MLLRKAVNASIKISVVAAEENARSISLKGTKTAVDFSQEFSQAKKELREAGFINQPVRAKSRTANKNIYSPVTVLRIKNTKMGSRLA